MKIPSIDKILLGITGGIVLLLGIMSYGFVFSSSEDFITHFEQNRKKVIQRDPSSFVLAARSIPKEVSISKNMSTFDLGCIKKNAVHNLEGDVKLLQVSGKSCFSENPKYIEVINRTNATRASIFQLKNKKFMSDYISISPGKNQLILTMITSTGEQYVNNVVYNQIAILTK